MSAVVLVPDVSIGVSPTQAAPLSQPPTNTEAITMAAPALSALPSRYAIWRSLESRADRLASYGALALGVLAIVAYVVI
jgi:hypothetical protein